MDFEFNRYKYLMYKIIDDYSIDRNIAEEYLTQMLHIYLHINPRN